MIRKWGENLCTSAMMIYNITPTVDCNQWSKPLNALINKPTNQNVAHVLEQDIPPHSKGVVLCIIIGDVNQFIGHCLIPLDPWTRYLR